MTEVLCVGGPLNGHTIQVVDVEHLPRQLTLPYAEADKPAYYRPTRMVLFGHAMWVLVHAPIHPDEPAMQHILALVLLSTAAYKAWSAAPTANPERTTP